MFKEKVNLFNEKAQILRLQVEKDEISAQDFIKFLQAGSMGLLRLYPKDWEQTKVHLDIKTKWEKVKEISNVLNEFVKEYKLDSEKGVVEITLDDGTTLIEPIRDLNLLLQIEWSIPRDHEFYLILLGFLSQENHYPLVQLYLCGKNLI